MGVHAGAREEEKTKNTLCKTWFFRGLPIRASMSPLLGAREEAKTKKPRFRKCGFFVVLVLRGSMSPLWEAREEETTKKPHLQNVVFAKRGFFVVCPYGPLCHLYWGHGRRQKRKNHVLGSVVFSWFWFYGALCHPCGRQGRRKKGKNTLCKTLVFSWFAHTGFNVTSIRGTGGGKNEKTTF